MNEKPVIIDNDPAAIVAEMIAEYKEKTGKTLTDADVDRLMIDVMAYRESLLRSKIQYGFEQNLIAYADYPAIDVIGEQKGISRLEASAAGCLQGFYLKEALSFSVTVSAGTAVKVEGADFAFTTVENLIIPAGNLSGTVRVLCSVPGIAGNGIEAGAINKMTRPISFIDRTENITATSGGADRESTQHYRQRLLEAPGEFSVAGPTQAYRYFALSAHADIIDVDPQSPEPSVVDVYVLTSSGTASEEILARVESALSADDVRPIGDEVNVFSAVAVEFSVTETLTILPETDADTVKTAAETALNELFLTWKQKLGQDILPDAVIETLRSVSGVHKVGLSPCEYVKMQSHQFPVCTGISLSVEVRK